MRKLKHICIIVFTCWSSFIQGQTLIRVYDSVNRNDSANLDKVTDSIIQIAVLSKKYLEAGQISHRFSIKKYLEGDYSNAIKYARKEVDYLDISQKVDNSYVNALYNLAYFYTLNNEFETSNELFQKIIKLNIDNSKVARSYGSIGQNYELKGDYKKAIDFLSISIDKLEKLKDYRNLITQKIILSNVYLKLNDSVYSHKGLTIANEIDSLRSKVHFDDQLMATLYKIYGDFYNLLGTNYFYKSRAYYLKSLPLSVRIKDSLAIGGLYSSLSSLYNKSMKDSAGYFGKKAISYLDKDLNNLSITYTNYVDYLSRSGQFTSAQENLDKIIKLSLNYTELPRTLEERNLFYLTNKYQFILLINQKLNVLIRMYLINNDQEILNDVIENSKACHKLVSMLGTSSDENFTKFYWRKKASQAYLYGAYASHLLGDQDQVFEFMEKNKALLLSESVLKNTEFANLPKHISNEETRQQKLIYDLESKLSHNSKNSIIQDSLFVAKRSHEKYVDSLKRIFPKFYARKIEVEQTSLSDVKKEMNKGQVLVSYIWNEFDRDNELVIGLVASNEFNRSFTIHKTDNLKSLIKDYQKLISRPFETKDDEKEFQHIAFKLYEMLFPDKEIRDLIMKKELMIIADGLLQNIPFESLIRTADVNDYLVLNNNIHYLYSYSFLEQNKKVNRKSTNSFIGYSPNRFTDSLLINLSHTREEVTDINSEFGGVIKLNDSATKKDFLENSSSAKIIHLATHADGGENPWVAFADDKLQLHELYTFKNNADLVTLSACNTSLGDMAKGEGVISLARGFFHSGSKSVVSSLWKVNDKSTSGIMRSFYKGLKGGETKSEALNNAKRAYLNTHSLSAQSPYYWSSFVLIGDSGKVDVQFNNYLYYGLLLLFIPLGVLVRKKFKKAG